MAIKYIYQGFNHLNGKVYFTESLTKNRFSVHYEDLYGHPAVHCIDQKDLLVLGKYIGILESKLGISKPVKILRKPYKKTHHYTLLVCLYSLLFFLSNITAAKLVPVFNVGNTTIILPAAIFIYAFSFFIDDIITEVWGLHAVVRAIRIAVQVNLIAFLLLIGVAELPILDGNDFVRDIAFGEHSATIRVFLISFLSFSISDFINGYILSKIKYSDYLNKTNISLSLNPFKNFLMIRRFLVSTGVGTLFDSFFFCFGAFAFTGLSFENILIMSFSQYIIKMLYECVACSTITSVVCNYIKKVEQLDIVSCIESGFSITDKNYY